jgi:hypothetical protein
MNVFLSRLDEHQRRWYAALESRKIGHGGDRLLSLITGLHVETIRRGRRELEVDLRNCPIDRIRRPGAGRPPVKKAPGIGDTLAALLEGETAGDPMTTRRWIRRSVRHLTEELQRQGYDVCPMTVRDLLQELGYSLRANRKRFTGPPHPDRDRQFRYIARQRQRFAMTGQPVLSVDTKKKELIGNFKNAGRKWCRRSDEVNAHDFRKDASAVAVPYGLYDLRHDRGSVYVGLSADTSEFAVDALDWWWQEQGRSLYAGAKELLLLCDTGGSNSCSRRLWKQQLQVKLADRWGLEVTVDHYPAGASKWNPVEHRLFSYISINWAAEPLRTLETLLACIRGTRTESGRFVEATVVEKEYPGGIKVSNGEMRDLLVVKHEICPRWNYTIKPRKRS